MDFIIRNLEALGDEVAAALDDLADEVTGRGNARTRDDDAESDDRSVASGGSGEGTWAGGDANASDTASCNSDDPVAPCPASCAGALPPAAPAAASMSSPDRALRQRKSAPAAPAQATEPPKAPPKRERTPVQLPAEPEARPLAANVRPGAQRQRPSPILAAQPHPPAPEAVDTVVSSSSSSRGTPPKTTPADTARRNLALRRPLRATKHMESVGVGTSPVVRNPPSPAALDQRDGRYARDEMAAVPPKAGSRDSSGFDLCDRDDVKVASPTAEGEYLVL